MKNVYISFDSSFSTLEKKPKPKQTKKAQNDFLDSLETMEYKT